MRSKPPLDALLSKRPPFALKGAAEAAEELRSMGNLDEIHLRPFGRLMRSKDPASLSWPIVTWRKLASLVWDGNAGRSEGTNMPRTASC
ncbi:MAG: hypothetical protein ACTS6A_02330 [Candidatus Hodgkinia cicadicola]